MNGAVREAVFSRARGGCELPGCGKNAVHLDHFFGRAKAPEEVEFCWALCLDHDEAKTRSRGGAQFWNSAFIRHCEAQMIRISLGVGPGTPTHEQYNVARERAVTKNAVLVAKGFA